MRDFFVDYNLSAVDGVVVLGKGPSYGKWADGDGSYPHELVVGINQAGMDREADLCFVSHVEPAVEVFRDRPDIPIVIPYYPIEGWVQSAKVFAEDYAELSGADLYGYNAYWHKQYGPSPVVNGSGTTAHHVIHLLAQLGIKDFRMFGIDGGKKAYGKQYYHPTFRLDDKRYFESGKTPTNYDAFWETFFQLRRQYGLSYLFA